MVNIPPIYGDDWGLVSGIVLPTVSFKLKIGPTPGDSRVALFVSAPLRERKANSAAAVAVHHVSGGRIRQVRLHTLPHADLSVHTHTRILYKNIYLYIYMCVCVRVCVIYRLIHLLMYERTYVCMHEKCVYIKKYIYVSVCIYIIYVYIYIYMIRR